MNDRSVQAEIAAAAAPWILEEGMDYGHAKRKARDELGLPDRCALPDNAAMDAALREHIALFLSDSQPHELRSLRRLAVDWMRRLAAFRPFLSGAVWSGLATRHSPITLQLFCDDPKMVDIHLINAQVEFDLDVATGVDGKDVVRLTTYPNCDGLGETVPVCLLVHELDAQRNARRSDALGQSLRGDLTAVEHLLRADHD